MVVLVGGGWAAAIASRGLVFGSLLVAGPRIGRFLAWCAWAQATLDLIGAKPTSVIESRLLGDISAYFQVRSHYRKMPILARLNAKIAVLNWRAVLNY
eukprot:COSAG06_NODE_69_length_26016_cov_6.603272_12_plen_98_part_00